MSSSNKLKLTSEKQKKGECYESIAEQFLQSAGLQTVVKNWLVPKTGEIDLIMIEKGQAWDILVFVEVRGRSTQSYGDALNSVTKSKQKKLSKTALYFLQQHPEYHNYECRFDVVGFTADSPSIEKNIMQPMNNQQVNWVRGAFLANAW